MEVFLKLVSVALVGVDTTGFQLSVAICLATAATIALAKPYAQPQVGSLECLGTVDSWLIHGHFMFFPCSMVK